MGVVIIESSYSVAMHTVFFTMQNLVTTSIETLESRIEMIENKRKTNKNRTCRMKRDFRRTKNRKFQLKVFELNKKLDVLEGSKNEIQNRLDIEKKYRIFSRKVKILENMVK